MEKLSVREAARRFDISRPTLVKHLKTGKLSGDPVAGGGWLIDPAELIRAGVQARPSSPDQVVHSAGPEPVKFTTIAGGLPVKDDLDVSALKAALAAAEQRAAVAEALADERAARIEDLRRMLPRPDAKRSRWWFWKPWE